MNLSNLPPGTTNYDIEEAAGAFDLESEDRCELLVDEDSRCPNRATRIVHEPFTPAAIRQRVCSDCARDQIDMGYIDGGAINGNT